MIAAARIRWPQQEQVQAEVPALIIEGWRRLLVTTPTGGGKTLMICDLIEWALSMGWYAILYTNRRLLIQQLSRVLTAEGIEFGVRASGHQDRRELPVQISSLPTERARVLKTDRWQVHGTGAHGKILALVDEAHLNAQATAQAILEKHHESGGAYVGFTATPIDLGHLYDRLIVAGTPSELRKCGALVTCYHYGPDEPDMRKFKQNVKTGEYAERDVRKAIMNKSVWARVLDWYGQLNPEGRPTILFGPGVGESIWFAEQFAAQGIRSAHIDGNGIWLDGEYRRCDLEERDAILDEVRAGTIKVLCNRFVAREGLDLPEVSHLILATVFGSLQSYLQSAGRGLRACPGKDRLTIQDHGGNYLRHGSVNQDRRWELGQTEHLIQGLRQEKFREKREPEPIRCPACGMMRLSGPKCHDCGHQSDRRSRMVVQLDGSLQEYVGDVYKPRRLSQRPDAERIWERVYYRAKRAGLTFRQAEALFAKENNWGWPSRDMRLMPMEQMDFFRKVSDVPAERLTR